MKVKPSTEATLDNFLKLPRTAQLMFFDKLNNINEAKNAINIFHATGLDESYCNSPIEKILNFAVDIRFLEIGRKEFFGMYIWLTPQKEILIKGKKYFADFYFGIDEYDIEDVVPELNRDFKLVIECDGHEYHHSTKQQVNKDYERETALKLAGYDVLRFTGSQIYCDPYGCADTIIEYIKTKAFLGATSNG